MFHEKKTTIKIKEVRISQKKIKFLNFIISNKKIKIDLIKINAIKK